ncbi:kinase-like protein [Nemania serpens]|nr:kinase-like protein [Nemania serpens]
MTARLKLPFRSLFTNNFVARGSFGHVFAVSKNVVFKCSTSFENPSAEQISEMKESARRIAHEQQVYEILMERRHPNIVSCVLIVPQGLFLHRLTTTLETRLSHSGTFPVLPTMQEQWIRQIISAEAWLEKIGLVHGDLRPANLLLDAGDTVQLCDFDAAVKIGEQLLVASEPYCKLNHNFELPRAGPVSEQFALGSCFYAIRFGNKPFHELDPPDRIRKLMRSEFPPTCTDTLLGAVITQCWFGSYPSLRAVECDVRSHLGDPLTSEEQSNDITLLKAECEEFLVKEGVRYIEECQMKDGAKKSRRYS